MHIIVCITSIKQTPGCDAVLCERYSLADAHRTKLVSIQQIQSCMSVGHLKEDTLKKEEKNDPQENKLCHS